MAKQILSTISRDEDERARFRARRKFQMDQEHRDFVNREEGRKEGLQLGLQQGREEGKSAKAIDIAKKLLQIDFAIDKIVEVTGLTCDEVENLRIEVNNNKIYKKVALFD